MAKMLYFLYPPSLVLPIDSKVISSLAVEEAIRAARLGDSDQLVELLDAGGDEALRNPKLRAFLTELARGKIKKLRRGAKNDQRERLVVATVEAGMTAQSRRRDTALRKGLMQKWVAHYGTTVTAVEEYLKRRTTREKRGLS